MNLYRFGISAICSIVLLLSINSNAYESFCATDDEFLTFNATFMDGDAGRANLNIQEQDCLEGFNLDLKSSNHPDWRAVIAPIYIPNPDSSSYKQMMCHLRAAFNTCTSSDLIKTDVSCYDNGGNRVSEEILNSVECQEPQLM